VEGTVEVFPQYLEGLRDLDGFSHILLLCHLHLSTGFALSVKPPSDTVTHGVFATRSPRRPNPISSPWSGWRESGATCARGRPDLVEGTPCSTSSPTLTDTPRRRGAQRLDGEPQR
jgi:tRNA (Thr-GGU) A37 N-methylase